MRRLNQSLLCAGGCLLALSMSGAALAQNRNQDPGAIDRSGNQIATAELPPGTELPAKELPDSPGAVQAQTQTQSQAPLAGSNQATPSPTQDQSAPAPQAGEQTPQRPVGTAAAEAAPVSGITAAQPAGVAVAPAKQHRVRTIVLRVGAIVGAGAAIGAVVALSEGTSSKPPGAH
jgi:hypothetical protein